MTAQGKVPLHMTTQDLRMLEVFSSLKEEELERLLPLAKIRHYAKGEILHYENDEIECVYFLLKGIVKIYKVDRFDNEIFLYSIKKSALITEFSCFGAIQCFANAECLQDCSILSLDLSGLKELFFSSPAILMALFKEFTHKTKELQYVINREIVFDGTAKVAHMLDRELEEFNALKKQDIAYMLNIQPETLSRILKKLHRDGVIATDIEGKIVVLNPSRLSEIYQ